MQVLMLACCVKSLAWCEWEHQSLCCAPVQAGLISAEDIIIDAKSGVSGAGRSAKQNLLYTEIAEGINCYGVGSHRHMPEIEQARPCYQLMFFFASDSGSGDSAIRRCQPVYQVRVLLWLSHPGTELARTLPTGGA